MIQVSRMSSDSRKKTASRFGLAGLLILLLSLSHPSLAQINLATITGTVTDSSGAVVPAATVTVQAVTTGAQRTTQTNGAGIFTVPLLQPGIPYTITVSKQGFVSSQQSNIELQVGQLAQINFALKVGAVGQTVQVSAAAPELETESAGLGTVISPKETLDLPLNGRQFTQLLQLAPGTVPLTVSQSATPGLGGSGSGGAITPAVNGQTNRSNMFFLDGIYASDPFFGTFSISPSPNAIQEFQEQTHTDQAQFGQSTGATINVATRAGTDQFHGSAYEFFRNAALAANNFFAPIKGAYNQNQFGGTVGGPVLKDKLFFFGFYDGYRQTQAANNLSVMPTTAELGGDFSALLPNVVIYDPTTYNPATNTTQPFKGNIIPKNRLNPGVLAVINAYYPTTGVNQNLPFANNYDNTANNTLTQNQYSARIDYNINSKNLLFGRVSISDSTTSTPQSLPVNPFNVGFNAQNDGINWIHTFSPTLVSQITFGYNRLDHPQEYLQPNASSLFTTAGFGSGFTSNPGDILVPKIPGQHPSGYANVSAGWGPIGPQDTYQYSGSVNKQEGKHALMFGASYYKTSMYTNWAEDDENYNQQATWNPCGAKGPTGTCTGTGGNSLASMLLGLPDSASRQLGNSGVNLHSTIAGLFAEDSWKIRPDLTVNYGLRWDYTAPITESNNLLSGFNVYTGQWYIPKGDTSAPTGPLPANVINSPSNTITQKDFENFSPRLGFAYQVTPQMVVSAGAGITFDNWSGALQAAQNARGAWPAGASQNVNNVNIAGLTPDTTAQNPFATLAPTIPSTPFPAGGGFLDTKWKNAYSLQWNLQIQQEISHAGVFSLAYVGSSTSREAIQVPFNISTHLGPTQVLPFPDMSQFNMLQSIGHMSYNALQAKYVKRYSSGVSIISSFTWSKSMDVGCEDYWEGCNIQNPYDMRSNRSVDSVDLPVVFTTAAVYELPFGKGKAFANQGTASKLAGDWQVNTIITAHSGQPFTPTINFDNANANGGTQRPNVIGNTAGPKTVAEYFNTAAFAVAPPYSYGDAGRNSLRGPGFAEVDLSLFRDFNIKTTQLEFRAEGFNILNHPNFANPDGVLEDPTFGQILSTYGAPRELQLAATFTF